jgi:pyruvate/2-oxoglutarate dehydrogenase complex dihydrolipoamide acyltransferase (E2) component
MESRGQKVEEPLVAQLPVNLRRETDTRVTNVVAILPVRLAGASPNPIRRLRQVSRSTSELKGSLAGLSQGAVITYTLLIQGAAQLGELLGLNQYIPPLGNILISNLPGPKQPLYLAGARMLEIYPISTIPPGMTMNITVFSYDGKMFFGMIAGYDAIPGLDELPGMLTDAMSDLEASVALIGKPQRGKPTGPPRAAQAARRAAAVAAEKKRAAKSAGPTPAQIAARAAARKKRGALAAEAGTGPKRAEKTAAAATSPAETTHRATPAKKAAAKKAGAGKPSAKKAAAKKPATSKRPAKKTTGRKKTTRKKSARKAASGTSAAQPAPRRASGKKTAGRASASG